PCRIGIRDPVRPCALPSVEYIVAKYMGHKLSGAAAGGAAASGARSSARRALADPATQAVLGGIRHILRAPREASRGAGREVGLGGAQLFVLQRLAGAPALSLNELAARTLTHQSSVSTVVSKLVRRGLVARTRADADGRRVEITLTAAGREVLGRA